MSTGAVAAGDRARTATLYVSPSGSDGGPCTRAAPCATLDRAYHAARPGDTVEVAGGRYPQQTITRDPRKPKGSAVVIQAARGATVVIGGRLSLGSSEGAGDAPSHIVLRKLTAPKKRVQVIDPARYVTLDRLRAGSFYIDGAQHVLVKGGDYGNCGSADPQCEGGGPGSQNWIKDDVRSSRTSDITVRGATIHDYYLQPGPYHYECMFLLGGTNITIEASHFHNCEIYDIFIQANGPHAIRRVTIQNNWFGRTMQPSRALRGSAVVIGQHETSSPLADVLIRYNSFAPGEALLDEGYAFGRYTNVRAVGNIFGVAGDDTTNPKGGGGFRNCLSSIAYDYNVWTSGSCGGHSRDLGGRAIPYVNASDGRSGDYHLRGPRTPADDLVPANAGGGALALDYDRQRRTAPRDAGSDERRR